MDEKKRLDAIQALERQINGLPIGCLLYTSDAADEL